MIGRQLTGMSNLSRLARANLVCGKGYDGHGVQCCELNVITLALSMSQYDSANIASGQSLLR
jgi:hypothetical protein